MAIKNHSFIYLYTYKHVFVHSNFHWAHSFSQTYIFCHNDKGHVNFCLLSVRDDGQPLLHSGRCNMFWHQTHQGDVRIAIFTYVKWNLEGNGICHHEVQGQNFNGGW